MKCLSTLTSMLDVFGTLKGVDVAVCKASAINYQVIWCLNSSCNNFL